MSKFLLKTLLVSVLIFVVSCNKSSKESADFTTIFEKSKGTETPEYNEVIKYYSALSEYYNEISLFTFGQTDSGEPLHLVVYDKNGIYNVDELKNSKKNRILINNGIHPGES
ncbi:MAG: hypothetical protein ABF265_09315, partial [Polaribacter sp.]